MMKRIGESDITRIVQLFQKQVTTPLSLETGYDPLFL